MSATDAQAVNKYVGRQIWERRRALNMTQGDLAARLGLSKPWVTLVESGQRGLSAVRLMAVAAALGAQPGDFLPQVVTRG